MSEKLLLEKIYKSNILIVILLVSILIVLSLGVSKVFYNQNNEEKTESVYNTDYDVSMFDEIKASEIKKQTKGETKVIYIGRETCSWCAAFLPSLWEAQEEYKYTTLYIDIAKIIDFSNGNVTDQNSFDILNKLSGKGFESYMEDNFGATPMILIIKDNKIIGASTGYTEYESFEKILNDSGIK